MIGGRAWEWVRGRLLWVVYLPVARRDEGLSIFWNRKGREEAFMRKLLVQFPGLAEQDPRRRFDVVWQVFHELARWRHRLIVLAVGIATGYACYQLAAALPYIGFSLTGWPRGIFVLAVMIAATDQVRRWQIRRALERAVVAEFPELFCACGYSRMGLEEHARCPECGAARPVSSC